MTYFTNARGLDIRFEADFSPGTIARINLKNGDPGDPGNEPDIDIGEIYITDGYKEICITKVVDIGFIDVSIIGEKRIERFQSLDSILLEAVMEAESVDHPGDDDE